MQHQVDGWIAFGETHGEGKKACHQTSEQMFEKQGQKDPELVKDQLPYVAPISVRKTSVYLGPRRDGSATLAEREGTSPIR